MKRGVAILAGLMIITMAGGVLTSELGFQVPIVLQTSDPAASYFEAPPGQANVFLLWILFVVGTLIANGALAALVFWFLNREVKIVSTQPNRPQRAASESESATSA